MKTSARRVLAGLGIAAMLAGLASTTASAEERRRAAPRSDAPRVAARSHSGTRAQAPATRDRSAVPGRTAPRATASGRATYGHGGYGGYGYYPGWYSGWYGYPWWSIDLYWGWPYWGPWAYAPAYGPYGSYAPVDYVYRDRGAAAFEIDVSPRRATVKVDGEDVGRAKDWDGRWDRLPVEPGNHVLTFDAPGYKSLRVAVDAAPGGTYRVSYDLVQGEGIDARSTATDVKAPPRPERPEVKVPSGTDGPSAGLARGFLRVKISPPDAAVYLDGAYFARADELARLRGAIPLVLGTHTVEVVRPGYESRKVDVDVAEGKPAEVTLDLERNR